MANRNGIMTKLGYCNFFLIVMAYMLSDEFAEASTELTEHKGTVKTIKNEDGDMIDCVDIYRQPAFDHPLLKNHQIEMRPTSYPGGLKSINSQAKITQIQKNNEHCPEGTIPIRRTPKEDYHHAIPSTRHRIHLNGSTLVNSFPQVSQSEKNYLGANAMINVWNPKVEVSNEFSAAQMWLISGSDTNLNAIQAGWMVFPRYYEDNQTRFYLYWTRDNYQTTGCYNLDCPGFVQTNKKFVIGGRLIPVSHYDKEQYDIAVTIYKNTISGNWWLVVQDEVIGYWPGSIFTSLGANLADQVIWGGEVACENSMGHHTSTQMGSGHFPFEGYKRSSYFRDLGVMDKFGKLRYPEKLITNVSYPTCYDMHADKITNDTYFFFGGPGYSDKCP